jgi:hypothetical protein
VFSFPFFFFFVCTSLMLRHSDSLDTASWVNAADLTGADQLIQTFIAHARFETMDDTLATRDITLLPGLRTTHTDKFLQG